MCGWFTYLFRYRSEHMINIVTIQPPTAPTAPEMGREDGISDQPPPYDSIVNEELTVTKGRCYKLRFLNL